MEKKLLTVEFRYSIRNSDGERDHKTKTITIGIFDSMDIAIEEGNKALKILAKTFEVRPDDKFIKNYLWGMPKDLVSNWAYDTKGVQYWAKITTLSFNDLEDTITDIFNSK